MLAGYFDGGAVSCDFYFFFIFGLDRELGG